MPAPDDPTPPSTPHKDYSGHTPSSPRTADPPSLTSHKLHRSKHAENETLSVALHPSQSNKRGLPPAKKKSRSHWCVQSHPAHESTGPHDSPPQNAQSPVDAPAPAVHSPASGRKCLHAQTGSADPPPPLPDFRDSPHRSACRD